MNWDPKAAPKLDFNEDFYAVLEVDPTIEQKELKRAYYKSVFAYHPDNKEGDEAKALCNKQMMVINNAYKTLKDPAQRALYDERRKAGRLGNNAKTGGATGAQPRREKPTPSPSAASSSSSFYEDVADAVPVESLGDMLSDLWGEIRRGGGTNLLEEVLDFFEDNGKSSTSSVFGSQSTNSNKSPSEIDAEATILNLALANLKSHLDELVKLRDQEEKQLLQTTSTARTVQELEARLQKIEALRSLEARVEAVRKQVRQMSRQIKDLELLRQSRRTRTTTRPEPSRRTATAQAAESKSTLVEKELEAMKKQMGLK